MKVEILGKRIAQSVNKETGEVREFADLYYVELKDMKNMSKTEMCHGSKTGHISTQMDISKINIGEHYDLEFEITTFQGNSRLRLVDYELIKGKTAAV